MTCSEKEEFFPALFEINRWLIRVVYRPFKHIFFYLINFREWLIKKIVIKEKLIENLIIKPVNECLLNATNKTDEDLEEKLKDIFKRASKSFDDDVSSFLELADVVNHDVSRSLE